MTSHPNSQNTTTYGIENTGPGLGQAQKMCIYLLNQVEQNMFLQNSWKIFSHF